MQIAHTFSGENNIFWKLPKAVQNDTLQKFQCLSTYMKSQEKRHNVLQRDEKIYWHIESTLE